MQVGGGVMRWPWQPKTENYESGYTDALIASLIRAANGNAGNPITNVATGALEAVAGLVGRGFAAAEVSGDPMYAGALTPDVLMMIGRSLIREGDNCFHLDTSDGLTILPCQTHSIDGGPMPSTWRYTLSLPGPSLTHGLIVDGEEVLHLRYAVDPQTPWRGKGPIGVAADAGRLSAEVLAALADESSGPRGSFLPLPTGDAATTGALKGDIKTARGTILTVESTASDWGRGGPAPLQDWQQQRFGSNPPVGLIALLESARVEIWASCGVSAGMFAAANSASLRESWRVALFGLLSPLGKIVQAELQRKIHPSITLDWTELRASDLQGRARSFQSMVGGGMPLADAVAISGLMTPPEPE